MSKISKAMAQAAAGAGGVLEYEVGAVMQTSYGGSLTNNYMTEMETSGTISGKEAGNYFCMLGSHGTSMNLHLMSVNPSTLAITHHDTYTIGSARDDRFGHGIAYNRYLGQVVTLRSYNGYFYANSFEIDYANNAIQGVGSSQNVGSESSWYRAPNDCSQIIRADSSGKFLQYSMTNGNQTVARTLTNTSSANWSTGSWSGNLWDATMNANNAIIRHPTLDNVFYAMNINPSTNRAQIGYIDCTSSTISGNVYSNAFDTSTAGASHCLMATDTKNLSTATTSNGKMLHAVLNYPNNNNYVGYRRYETSNTSSNYYFTSSQVSLQPDTNYISALDQYYIEDGSSGNLCAIRGIYNGGSNYQCALYQMVYNDSEGWAGPQQIFRESGPNNSAYRSNGHGVYLSNADCSVMAYKDVYQSYWFARAFRGRRSA